MKKQNVKGYSHKLVDKVLANLKDKYNDKLYLDREQWDGSVYPTGNTAIDWATGCGGIPKGRIVQFIGPPSSGKTTLAVQAVAATQKKYPERKCIWVDAEHSLDLQHMQALGVNISKLIIIEPQTMEIMFDTVRRLAITNEISLVVVDSVSTLIPSKELGVMFAGSKFMSENGEIGDTKLTDYTANPPAIAARVMTIGLRTLIPVLSNSNTSFVGISQIRANIALMGKRELGTGGNALQHNSSVVLNIRYQAKIDVKGKTVITGDTTSAIGIQTRVRNEKSKVGIPFRTIVLPLWNLTGFDSIYGLLQTALVTGVIEKQKVNNKSFYMCKEAGISEKDNITDISSKAMYDLIGANFGKLEEIVHKQLIKKIKRS